MFNVRYRELLAKTPGLQEELDAFYKRLTAFLLVAHNDDGTLITPAPAQISDLGLAIGTVVPYAGASVPTGWLLCDGTAYSRSTYSSLFGVIGTTFGNGDGATTFNVPNFQQKFPLGVAASGTGNALGATGGSIDHTHTGAAHTHTITSTSVPVAIDAGAVVNSVSSPTGSGGAGTTGTANPPFLAVNFIILYV